MKVTAELLISFFSSHIEGRVSAIRERDMRPRTSRAGRSECERRVLDSEAGVGIVRLVGATDLEAPKTVFPIKISGIDLYLCRGEDGLERFRIAMEAREACSKRLLASFFSLN